MWLLAVILQIGDKEAIIRPYYIIDGYYQCLVIRDQLQPYTSLPLTCTREAGA